MKHIIHFRSNQISIETLKNAQNRLDLSNNVLLDLAASLRSDDVKIEPGLREDLYESGTMLKDYFEVRDFDLEIKENGEIVTVKKSVVFCTDVPKFVEFVKEKRGICNDVILKYGADGGGKMNL